MKKLITFCSVLTLFLSVVNLKAQVSTPGEFIYIKYEPGIGSSSIPAQQFVNFRDVDIIVDYIGNWPPDAMAAFDFAVSIWEHHLTSTVPIRVEAEFTALPTGVLGGARPAEYWRNFNADPAPFADTWYPVALANKLAEEDLNPDEVDIVCQFTTNAQLGTLGLSWSFDPDTPPSATQIDFATVILHELGHGVMGGTSTAVSQFGVGVIGNGGFGGFPTIYDSFVIDCTNNDQLIDQPNNTVQLGNFLTSGNLCWGDENGNTNCMANGNPPQLFAPNPFQPGSSISHLDDGTYPMGDPNSLMTPSVGAGEQILQVGDLFLCMMEETGWMVDFTTGIEDELVIYEWPSLLNEGQNFEFRATFYDEEPYGDYINNNSHEWKIEPLNNNGFYPLLVTQSSMAWNYWPDQLPYLPTTNYTWQRNPDGTIRTKATLSADDNVGIFHSDNVDIGIRFIPDQPELESDYLGCYEVKLTFYAPGATSYEIYYDTDPGVPYNGTGLPQGNSPITVSGNVNSITLTNLSPQYYFFNVRGKNSTGYSIYAVEEYELIPIEERDCGGVVEIDDCVTESLAILDISDVSIDDYGTVFFDLIKGAEMATYYGPVGSASIDLAALNQNMTFYSSSDYVQIQDGYTYTVRMRYPFQGVYKSQEASFEVSNSLLCGRSSAGGSGEEDVNGEPTPMVFEIVPNPANSFAIANINVPDKEAKVEIRVMGQLGQVLQNHVLYTDKSKTNLDISGLPSGLYFVQLRLDNQPIETQRLVVSR